MSESANAISDANTTVKSTDKYTNGSCPRCPGYLMLNSRTGKPFMTCYKCSTKCPTKDCNGFRGKPEGKKYRYFCCAKCTYGDKFKKPERNAGKNAVVKTSDAISLGEVADIDDTIVDDNIDTVSN